MQVPQEVHGWGGIGCSLRGSHAAPSSLGGPQQHPSPQHPTTLSSLHPRVLSTAAGINYALAEQGGHSPGWVAQHVLGRASVTLCDSLGIHHTMVLQPQNLPVLSLGDPIAPC